MKLDRFTWIVIAVVVVILVAAVVTVNATGGRGFAVDTYLDENSPAAPVFNAFVAFQQGDIPTARRQYSTRILDESLSELGYSPFSDRFVQRSARRLRIVEVTPDVSNPDRAYVTVTIDTYSASGFFGTGSTWTRRLVVDVVREPSDTEGGDALWKLDTPEFFY